MTVTVKAYTVFNTTHEWEVLNEDSGREYAKRIIVEGLWLRIDEQTEVFYPSHQIVKVKVITDE